MENNYESSQRNVFKKSVFQFLLFFMRRTCKYIYFLKISISASLIRFVCDFFYPDLDLFFLIRRRRRKNKWKNNYVYFLFEEITQHLKNFRFSRLSTGDLRNPHTNTNRNTNTRTHKYI